MTNRRSLLSSLFLLPAAGALVAAEPKSPTPTDDSSADAAALPQDLPGWMGDDPHQSPTAWAILEANPFEYDDQQIAAAARFYGGDQWPQDVEAQRLEDGRPTLVVNRLPGLVAAALDAHRKAGYKQLDADDFITLMVIVTRRNRDAQRVFNYMVSAAVEREVERRLRGIKDERVSGTTRIARDAKPTRTRCGDAPGPQFVQS